MKKKHLLSALLYIFLVVGVIFALSSCETELDPSYLGIDGASENGEFKISYFNTMDAENTNADSYTTDGDVINLSPLSKPGYIFDGWYNGDEKVDTINKDAKGDIKLVAKWSLVNYSINFVGAEGVENENDTYFTVESDDIVLKPISKPGYQFDGWFMDGVLIDVIPSGTSMNITIEARWTRIELNIVWEGVDGIDGDGIFGEINGETDKYELKTPEKKGYDFDGWYVDGEYVTELPIDVVESGVVIEARWVIINFNIIFVGVDGAENNNPGTYNVETGNVVLNDAVKPGYTFDGWYNGDRKVDEIPADTLADITIEAHFTVIIFNIVFEGVDGAVNTNNDSFTVEDGFTLSDLEMEGRRFDGWYNGNDRITDIVPGTVTDLTLVARWVVDININVFKAGTDYDLGNSLPVAGATVTIVGNGINTSVTVDDYGKFSITGLPVGEYTFTFVKVDYIEFTITIIIDLHGSHDFYMDIEQSSSLTGKIYEADSDLNISNNPVISDATITLTKESGTNPLVLTATTDSTGTYTFEDLTAGIYLLSISKDGYVTESLYVMVEERATTVQNVALEIIKQPEDPEITTGNASGMIYNAAVQGNVGVEGLTLTVKAGINNVNGSEILGTYVSGSNGYYYIEGLEVGNYTVVITDDRDGIDEVYKFSSAYFNIKILPGETITDQNGSVFPNGEFGELKVVLTWGSSPSDLDSHITGPTTSTSSRFHVYYSSKTYSDTSLDKDDTTSYGPETITVTNPTGGVYRYSVHNYSNRSSTSSTVLANSGATVKVYIGGRLVYTFYVPNQVGTLWTVFEYDATTGVFTAINTMSNQSNPSSIT